MALPSGGARGEAQKMDTGMLRILLEVVARACSLSDVQQINGELRARLPSEA